MRHAQRCIWIFLLCCSSALAQTYPDRNVVMVAPFPAGGSATTVNNGQYDLIHPFDGELLWVPLAYHNKTHWLTLTSGQSIANLAHFSNHRIVRHDPLLLHPLRP